MSQSGYISTASSLDEEKLKALVGTYAEKNAWRFLRWPHQVRLLAPGDPVDYQCREGQLFNAAYELRWKRQREGIYTAMLLSVKKEVTEPLQAVENEWLVKDLDARLYPKTETRFPKGLSYEETGAKSPNIGQRYFINAVTGTVHFVALRVKDHDC